MAYFFFLAFAYLLAPHITIVDRAPPHMAVGRRSSGLIRPHSADAGDGFNHFTGKLVLHPGTGRFAIVAEGEPTTESRYALNGDVLRLTTGGVQVEYRRMGLSP